MNSLLNYVTYKYMGKTNYKSMDILAEGPRTKPVQTFNSF